MKLGLRIDVDTYRGTKIGVQRLCDTMAKHNIKGTFFFSVGPDNMGRHLWRLIKPAFLIKMLRSRAASLYGWDILLRGTLLPGPLIGRKCANLIRRAVKDGHEIGLHAWDHHAWQANIERMDGQAQYRHIEKGAEMLRTICAEAPVCSAAPGWKANEETLLQKERFAFRYNSDCRGASIFIPEVNGKRLSQPQIPVTLPTYDEIIGREGITNENFNDHLLALIKPDRLNVLTIHAEVEGIICSDLFDRFLAEAAGRGIEPVPLGELLNDSPSPPVGRIVQREIMGREGWIASQSTV